MPSTCTAGSKPIYPVREGDELRRSAFQRRQRVDYGPLIGQAYIHSPEDLILYKLIYFGLSQQSNHSRDIAGILRAKKNELDFEYNEEWVTRLGLTSIWKGMRDSIMRDPASHSLICTSESKVKREHKFYTGKYATCE